AIHRRLVEPASRAEEELAEILSSTGDIAADEVGIPGFQFGWLHRVAGKDPRPEAGGVALDLRLDRPAHVGGRTVGGVAVRPGGVLARRRAGRVKQARM